jgi:hypothetical protein
MVRVQATQADRERGRPRSQYQDRLGVLLGMGRDRRSGAGEGHPRPDGHHPNLRASHALCYGPRNDTSCQSGLYAAFLSAFLIDMLSRLEEDPSETTRDVLIHQTRMMRNATLGPFEPRPFEPSDSVMAVNVLLFTSLATILMAAFISILVKGWIREMGRGLRSISVIKDRAIIREYRAQGFERYKLPQIVAFLPLLIYVSLFLFSCGLTVFLLSIHRPSAITIAVIMAVGVLFYGITLSLSILDASAPFRSPISRLGYLVFRGLYMHLPTDRWYFQWVFLIPRFGLPRWLFALVAKMLLWKPHTENGLVNLDHANPLTLDLYLVTRSSQAMEAAVLNTVYSLPHPTASKLHDVHQSLIAAGGDPMHHGLVNMPGTLLKPLIGRTISLDQARTIANLIVWRRVMWSDDFRYSANIGVVVTPLLKSSSDHWDQTLAVLMSMCTAGQDTADDLADSVFRTLKLGSFTLSQIFMILNSIRVFLEYKPRRDKEAGLLAAARIGYAILTYTELSIVELAFFFFHFAASTQADAFMDDGSHDGKLFFSDDVPPIDLLLVFDSFPSFIRDFGSRCGRPKAWGAFAIRLLIRLRQVSPTVYWRIMEDISSEEVREWAREIMEWDVREAVQIIFHSQGIVRGPPDLDHHRSWNMNLQLYDQSLDAMTVDLDRAILHNIFWETERRSFDNPSDGVFPVLTNIWLAIHAQTADHGQQLPIPVEHIQWIDHPISEMIALRRLSAYQGGRRQPEPVFINLFLHSASFEVLFPTLHCHLAWLRALSIHDRASVSPSDELLHSGLLGLLSNALKVLLRPNLAPNQLTSSWMLFHPLCGTQWSELPDLWKSTFLQSFFSVITTEEGSGSTKLEYLGVKWLEAVWEKVLKHRSRKVAIPSIQFPWPGVEGGQWDKSDREIALWKRNRDIEKEEKQGEGVKERELNESVTRVPETLVKLLEAANLCGLITTDLADSAFCSPLLSDDHFQRDQLSLGHIKAILCPFLVPLPLTPSVENAEIRVVGAVCDHKHDSNTPVPVPSDTSSHFSCHLQLPW